MGKYLDMSRRIQAEMRLRGPTDSNHSDCELSELGERRPLASHLSLISHDDRPACELVEIPVDPDKAFAVLGRLHTEHVARLHGGGIARVMLTDWRQALAIDELTFRRALIELEKSGQIIREHGYARPAPDELP